MVVGEDDRVQLPDAVFREEGNRGLVKGLPRTDAHTGEPCQKRVQFGQEGDEGGGKGG